jgi:3-oxoadipate enol-lactonase
LPWIEANGLSFHYELEGSNGPTVVLMHELGGSLVSWDNVAPGLAPRYRVLRYDQRGFGLSEKVRTAFDLEAQVDDFVAITQALQLKPPFHLVCVAAATTQALAFMKRGGAIGSLVLCNPAPGVDASRAEQLENVAAQAEREGMRSILSTMLARSYPPELSDKETYETYRGRYIANDPVGFALAFRVLARTDTRPLLEKISAPTMVVSGRQDNVRPVAVSEELAGKIPGARFEAIDAGHMMPVTAPKALLALLLDFLPR